MVWHTTPAVLLSGLCPRPQTHTRKTVGMFPEQIEIVNPQQWRVKTLEGSLKSTDRKDWGRTSKTISIDFETAYSAGHSVDKLGTWSYCHDPEFEAFLVAVTDGNQTCVCLPQEFPWQTINGMNWVSHNRDFDRGVWLRLMKCNIIPRIVGPANWFCTAALMAYLQHARDLAGAILDVCGVKLDKSVRGRLKGKRIEPDLFGFPDDIMQYAARDAEACLALWDKMSGEWPEHERRLFELTSAMGRKGLCIDWHHVLSSKHKLHERVSSLAATLPWKPALSLKAFQSACSVAGVAPPESTSANDPRFISWITDNCGNKVATWVHNLQRMRSAKRTTRVLESMERRRMSSGRMTYELKYFGASTGRWSGGGGLNVQNLNRQSAEGVDIRRAIIAPSGHRLVSVDYSQIESRVLLYLASDTETLAMFQAESDADAYEIHARATMGFEEKESLRAHCERTGSNLRQVAKARVLGLGFGCGPRKFMEVAKAMAGLDLSYRESRRIVKEFRSSNPSIVDLWSRLNYECALCVGGDYVLPLPCTVAQPKFKRKLIYRDVRFEDDGMVCTVGGKRTRVYGGLLTENWTQATARDILASVWMRCVDAGYVPILSVHDELVFEVALDSAEEDLTEIVAIMEAPLDWAPGLPLKCDGKLMDYYRK